MKSKFMLQFVLLQFTVHARGGILSPKAQNPALVRRSGSSSKADGTRLSLVTAVKLRGGQEVSDLVEHSFEWTSNLGSPAALVAGAVIATLYENIRSGDLALVETDSPMTRLGKKITHTLLVSAFVMEIICIFVSTVTGTVLMTRPLDIMDDITPITPKTTPLSFLRGNFEFEYLTARITFLQGLFNWMIAIALTHAIPSTGENAETRRMNRFISSTLLTTVVLMLSFCNKHLTFHTNYFFLLKRWCIVSWTNYFGQWPPRPLVPVLLPLVVLVVYSGWKAFFAVNG